MVKFAAGLMRRFGRIALVRPGNLGNSAGDVLILEGGDFVLTEGSDHILME